MKCPICEQELRNGAVTCQCGWVDSAPAAPERARGIWCAVLGCPSIAHASRAVTGGGRFYCRWHFAAVNTGADASEVARITQDLTDNPPPAHVHWSDELTGNHKPKS